MALESPQKDLLINTSYILRQLVMVKILSRSTGNYHVTIYQITKISETATINALVLGSVEAFSIMLRMSLRQP